MKLTDMLVSAVIKKGILYEARNVDMEFAIPKGETSPEAIKIRLKAEHMSLKVEKDD